MKEFKAMNYYILTLKNRVMQPVKIHGFFFLKIHSKFFMSTCHKLPYNHNFRERTKKLIENKNDISI